MGLVLMTPTGRMLALVDAQSSLTLGRADVDAELMPNSMSTCISRYLSYALHAQAGSAAPHRHSMHSAMTYIGGQSNTMRQSNKMILTAFAMRHHRKHCRIVARTDGAADVQCIASQNPINIFRKVNDGATLQTLSPGGQRTHLYRATSILAEMPTRTHHQHL
jgi:hypothetical protein